MAEFNHTRICGLAKVYKKILDFREKIELRDDSMHEKEHLRSQLHRHDQPPQAGAEVKEGHSGCFGRDN